MRRIELYIGILLMALLAGCNVHEWPEKPDAPVPTYTYQVHLDFDTDMGEQIHFYDSRSADLMADYEMRYTVKAFPYLEARNNDGTRSISRSAMWSHTFTRPVSLNDYDCTVDLDLPEGEYTLMVWADFVKRSTTAHYFYNPDDFTQIVLHGEHKANTDLRDAFRGVQAVEIVGPYIESRSENVIIVMERPLGKFTVVTTDLLEFFEREEEAARKRAESRGEEYDESRGISLDDYNVVFYYGNMPNTYSMFTDKHIETQKGVQFKSKLERISEAEARMGFDYVMVHGTDPKIQISIGLLDAEDKLISMSDEINVPLNRSVNTIVRGKFLMQEANGGIGINPDFEGDHNIKIP